MKLHVVYGIARDGQTDNDGNLFAQVVGAFVSRKKAEKVHKECNEEADRECVANEEDDEGNPVECNCLSCADFDDSYSQGIPTDYFIEEVEVEGIQKKVNKKKAKKNK